MRAAVVDIGTNSTRLSIADIAPAGAVAEIVRRSVVTRLGAGVDAEGALSGEGRERVMDALRGFREEIDAHQPPAGEPYPNLAVMTSAVRDAHNGREFAARVRDEYNLDARILTGEEEARMTFLGAMSGRPDALEPTVVLDIGGGSTEFIVGVGRTPGFHVSLPAGVVRMSERHIHGDPPRSAELQALATDTREVYIAGLPTPERAPVKRGIAVAGTATSAAAIDQELDPYNPERVHGYPLLLAAVEMLLARLADMDEAQRRAVVGLDPARAPTIVAGMILLSEAMRAFGLDQVEVSEHDILHGGLLSIAFNNSDSHGSSDI
jgi:exopolyphosphatase / guanosine-5'-triphosphate,3'-diphosphate pyrophosphatase